MGGRSGSGSKLRRGSLSRLLVVLGAVGLLVGAVTACTPSTPQAVLNVPGNYVANLWNPPPGIQQGGGAGVLMCLDEASAVRLETGEGGQGSVGSIHLTWGDADYLAQNSGSPVVDGRGRLVGVNFDRVWENVAGDFGFDPAVSRNISVDIRYLLWQLDRVEHADGLLRELGAGAD